MKRLSFKELTDSLKSTGLKEGDDVFVHSSLSPIGPVEAGDKEEEILGFYLEGFKKVLGKDGTLLVYTAFEDYGRFGTSFVLEESPSRTGIFSEFVRKQPGAIRSLHPINSVTALGARAKNFCSGPHYEGFGYDSPWGRIHRAKAMILSLGLSFVRSLTWIHYIEAAYGVPYKYTKLYNAPVYKENREMPGPFTMNVRYLDFSIAFTVQRFQDLLFERGAAKEVPIGRAKIHCVNSAVAFDLGIEALSKDRYFFLKEPPKFRPGEPPADGFTGPLKDVYHSKGPNVTR